MVGWTAGPFDPDVVQDSCAPQHGTLRFARGCVIHGVSMTYLPRQAICLSVHEDHSTLMPT